MFASIGYTVKSSLPLNSATLWDESVTTSGFKVCVLEYGKGSNESAEVNWVAFQSTPYGSQFGSITFNYVTTGTQCKSISFTQIRHSLISYPLSPCTHVPFSPFSLFSFSPSFLLSASRSSFLHFSLCPLAPLVPSTLFLVLLFFPSPLIPSPRLPVSPSPRLPVSPSPRLPAYPSTIRPFFFPHFSPFPFLLFFPSLLPLFSRFPLLPFCPSPFLRLCSCFLVPRPHVTLFSFPH